MDRPWITAGLKFARVRQGDLPSLLVQRVARIRPKAGVDADYLHSVIASSDFTQHIQTITTGTAVPHISGKQIQEYKFNIPDIVTQRSVGSLLMAFDDRITLLRETNTTLEAIAQALFKSWFVDFDPVRARMEGRAPEGMDEATAALFPDGFEESELGLVPRGWVVKRLSDVLKAKNERVEQLIVPEYASTNEGLVPRAKIYKKQLAASSSKNKLIRRGDLIFGLSRQVLNFGQMQDEIGSVSSAYKIYQIDAHEVIPELLGRLIRTRSDYFFNAVSASSREGQSVSSDALGMLNFVQPPIGVQNILGLAVQPLLTRGFLCLNQAESLNEIRDTLLPHLISGQLRLPEAEALLEEACA